MLANVYTKTIRERWRGITIGAAAMGLMLWLGMAAYQDVDMSFFNRMPEAWLSLMNIGGDADATALAYGAIYSSYGALVVASLALGMGSASIAGEERNGTLGLLLGNPRSRVQVLLAKAGSLVTLMAAAGLLLWGVGLAVPAAIGADVTGMHVDALVVHVFVVSVFFGFMAMAIGAWTGNRTMASGITAGFMVFSFIIVGILPLVEGWGRFAKAFPWYYYTASTPVDNGIDWGHLAVLAAGAVVLLAIAVVGLRRRDLKEQGTAVTMLDRLRTNPRTAKIMEKIAGSARVSGVGTKAISDHQTLTIVVGYVMVLMAAFIGPFYLLIDEVLVDFIDQFPEALLAMIGFADMSTPEGWYQTEIFSLSVPVAFLVVTVVIGAKALAGEEAQRTMGLLLANPIGRTRVLVEKAIALTVTVVIVAVLTYLGTMAGSLLGGLGLSFWNVAATTILATMLALVFGALALAISAATGSVRAAAYGASGTALVLYIINAFFPLSDSLAGMARWSPFYYFLTSDPLNNGMHWGHLGVLAALCAVLIAAAVMLFNRRDLRQTG